MKRYFTNKDHSNQNAYSRRHVFWEISVDEKSIEERAGVEHMPGTLTSSDWEKVEDAVVRAEQLIQDKLREGYREAEPPEQRTWFSSADAATEEKFLNSLEAVANDKSGHFHFKEPASADTVDELEYDCGIILPLTLRTFLRHYDGGFIWQHNSRRFRDELQEMKDYHPEWDDVTLKSEVIWPRLHGVEEIRESCKWSQKQQWGPGVIPFCKTHNGEVLCVWSVREPHQDSPIFNAFHETRISEWEILYPTFAHLFIDFIQRKTFDCGWAPYYDDEIVKTSPLLSEG